MLQKVAANASTAHEKHRDLLHPSSSSSSSFSISSSTVAFLRSLIMSPPHFPRVFVSFARGNQGKGELVIRDQILVSRFGLIRI